MVKDYLSFLYWLKIICHFFIIGKHMTNVTYEKIFLIYALIREGFDINIGEHIISAMKKMCYHQGNKYKFCGLLT